MRNILFPTDFSEHSKQALEYTSSFAEALESELTLMNTFQATGSPRRPFIGEGTVRHKIAGQLRALANSLSHTVKRVRVRVKEGNTTQRLLEASRHISYDMIAMGRSVRYDWLARVLGSTTARVSVKAHCPVLVVPPAIEYTGVKNILIAYGLHPDYDQYVSAYLDHFDHLSGLHIHYIPVSNVSPERYLPESLISTATVSANMKLFPYQKTKTSIQDYIEEHQIDLLMMPTRHQPWLSRFFYYTDEYKMILESEIPVLVFNGNSIRQRIIPKGHRSHSLERRNFETARASA